MEEEKIIYMVHGDGVVPVRASEIVSLSIPEIDPSADPAPEYAFLLLKSQDGKHYGQYQGGISSSETADACFRPKNEGLWSGFLDFEFCGRVYKVNMEDILDVSVRYGRIRIRDPYHRIYYAKAIDMPRLFQAWSDWKRDHAQG